MNAFLCVCECVCLSVFLCVRRIGDTVLSGVIYPHWSHLAVPWKTPERRLMACEWACRGQGVRLSLPNRGVPCPPLHCTVHSLPRGVCAYLRGTPRLFGFYPDPAGRDWMLPPIRPLKASAGSLQPVPTDSSEHPAQDSHPHPLPQARQSCFSKNWLNTQVTHTS